MLDIVQAHFQANFLLWQNNSREIYADITFAAHDVIVPYSVFSYWNILHLKRSQLYWGCSGWANAERDVYAWTCPPAPITLSLRRNFFLALFNCNLHLSLTYGDLFIKDFKPPICSCSDFSIDIWMHLHRKQMEISLMIINVVSVYSHSDTHMIFVPTPWRGWNRLEL